MSSTVFMKWVCPTMRFPPSGISRRTDLSSMRTIQNTTSGLAEPSHRAGLGWTPLTAAHGALGFFWRGLGGYFLDGGRLIESRAQIRAVDPAIRGRVAQHG